MDLRSLKKEVHSLQNVEGQIKDFQNSWVKPLRTNSNSHIPFLKALDADTKAVLNKKIHQFNKHLAEVKEHSSVNDKLKTYIRYLIDLKLSEIQGNGKKMDMLTNRLVSDEFLNMRGTISQVKHIDTHMEHLQEQYHEINDLLQKKLSLEEAIFFMDLPHKLYLYNLKKTAQKQKTLVRKLGRHFIKITRQRR